MHKVAEIMAEDALAAEVAEEAAADADAADKSNRSTNIASSVESTNIVTAVEVRVINSVLAYEMETKPVGPITIIQRRTCDSQLDVDEMARNRWQML